MSKWFEQHLSDWKAQSYLLATSGGVDSVVLCYLFSKLGLNFEIAHCNFQLRNEESDGDADFVSKLAKELNVKIHINKFNTAAYAEEEKISIQEAARNLRYEWFEEIRGNSSLDYIVVGTHKSDEVETLLINQIRGAGIRGLHGILPVKGNVIRPLLSVTREQILEYAKENKLTWREDSSNASEKYMRNKIRHQVIPVLKEIRENVEFQFADNAQAIRDYQKLIENEILRLKPTLMTQENQSWKINKDVLSRLTPGYIYLYELLLDFGFSYSTCKDTISSLNNQPGGIFYGKKGTLINDREFLFLEPESEDSNPAISIDYQANQVYVPLHLKFETLDASNFQISLDNRIASLDFDKLQFPLTLRKWKNGDRFQPFGMNGMKKISDFLIDNKVPRHAKSSIFVLESGDQIVWVVGLRINDNFKIKTSTKKVFQVSLQS